MAEQNQNNQQPEQDINQLVKVRREKLAALQEAGKDPFQITKFDQTHHTNDAKALYEEHEAVKLAGRVAPSTEGLDEAAAREVINTDYNERREIMDADPINVSIAGRMMFKRVMGKASFCNIQDLKGKISNESPVGKALIGAKVGDVVDVETVAGVYQYKVLDIQSSN